MSEPTSPQTLEWQDELRSIVAIADDHRYSSEAVGMAFRNRIDALRTIPTPAQPTKSAPVNDSSLPSGESDPPVMPDCAGADTQSSDETVEALREEEMSLRVALDFAEHPRPYPSLQAPADTMEELREALRVLAKSYRALALLQTESKA